MTVSEQIRTTRKARGLTQYQLAALVGCSTSTISSVESGYFSYDHWAPSVLAALELPPLPDSDEDEPIDLAPHLAGRPRCLVCGVLLFPTPDQVPAGWVVEYHLADGQGNCLEHTGPQWMKYRMRHQ